MDSERATEAATTTHNCETEISAWQRLQEAFRAAWQGSRGRPCDVGTLVGCSGGADSVALVRLLADLWRDSDDGVLLSHGPLVVAHFNHQLREDASDEDEAFVRALALDLGLPCVTSTHSGQRMSDEASLREQRRVFFQSAAGKHGCRYVAIAHSEDDQVETILHNLLRGTGIAGLAGMSVSTDLGEDIVLRRPLLGVSRLLIRDGLRQIGQNWREDASNQSSLYTRNWIRNELIPKVTERFSDGSAAILRAGHSQSQAHGMLLRCAENWLEIFKIEPGATGQLGPFDEPSPDNTQPNRSSYEYWTIRRPPLEVGRHRTFTNASDSNDASWSFIAREPLVIVLACQTKFDRLGWPRRDMTQQHWNKLADEILTPPDNRTDTLVSIGHWPGGVEGFSSRTHLTLRRPINSLQHPGKALS